ncbi:hypothetical protein [Runella sp.]|uniref:hypothetical protein n=1 Tax=Runella sp. TaxID=1960881 RepID=UPI003D0B744A
MAKTDPKRLKFLMDVDEAIQAVEKEHPSNNTVTKIKDRFYSLANQEFTRSTLREIHELAIEDILEKQAQNFYGNFPPDIQKELVHTFIEMEHQRRRDNFLEFCLFLFKQIECYVNYNISSGTLFQRIIDKRTEKAFVWQRLYFDNNLKEYQNRTKKFEKYGQALQNEVLNFYNIDYDKKYPLNYRINATDIRNLDIMAKCRVIIYCLYFNEKVEDFEFESAKNTVNEIYQLRNAAHGGKFSEIKQKLLNNQSLEKKEQILYDAWQNRYVNYLKYMGFLADFMQKVSNSSNLNLV